MTSSQISLGFAGIGLMGLPMCRRLLQQVIRSPYGTVTRPSVGRCRLKELLWQKLRQHWHKA